MVHLAPVRKPPILDQGRHQFWGDVKELITEPLLANFSYAIFWKSGSFLIHGEDGVVKKKSDPLKSDSLENSSVYLSWEDR